MHPSGSLLCGRKGDGTHCTRTHKRVRRLSFCLLLAALPGCPTSEPNDASAADANAPDGGASDALVDASADASRDAPSREAEHLDRITTRADFDALATTDQELKFLTRSPAGALPGPLSSHDCAFSNSRLYPFHIQFLRSLEGLEMYSNADYAAATQRRDSRTYAPGSLYWFPRAQHPSGALGVMAYTLSVASDQAPDTVASWADYDRRLGGCVDAPTTDLVLIGVDPTQDAWLTAHRTELAAANVTVMTRAELSTSLIEVYSAGETYGYVNTVAPGEAAVDYGPRDIVIVDAADEEISVASGLVTTFPQSFGSHLNLRMREKRLPNLRWRSVREQERIRALEGALVHLVVEESGAMRWERANLADAEAFWRARQPALPAPRSDLTVTAFRPMADLQHEDALSYGVKAANLGEIFDALPAPYRPDGFGIPFATYAEHIARNSIQPQIDTMLADPAIRTDRLVRVMRLDAVRRAINRAPLAPGLLDRIAAQLRTTYGVSVDTTFIRFRSSTNAEDLEEFSGAGLYDSKTGCLADDLDGDNVGPSRCLSTGHRDALTARRADYQAQLAAHPDRTWLVALIDDIDGDLEDEKPIADALRKVWRSLWNVRAFDERTYYGIDHTQVFMGVAVVPTMVMERSESVVLTNLPHGAETSGLYRLVTQLEDIGVVRPSIPTAEPEEMTFLADGAMGSAFTVVHRSSESPDADLWSASDRVLIARLLIQLQQHFATQVYPEHSPLRLDIELDVAADGTPIFKQARPYLGVTP